MHVRCALLSALVRTDLKVAAAKHSRAGSMGRLRRFAPYAWPIEYVLAGYRGSSSGAFPAERSDAPASFLPARAAAIVKP